MLHAGAAVEIEVLFDLRFLAPLGRFVDRKLNIAIAVGDHLAHQGGVFGRDVLVVKSHQQFKAHHILVKLHPFVHIAEVNVADAVVNVFESGRYDLHFAFFGHKTGHKRAVVGVAFNESMDGFAVCFDGSRFDPAVLVFEFLDREGRFCAAFEGGMVGFFGIVNPEGQHFYAVAMFVHVVGHFVIGAQGGSEHQPDLVLLQNIRGTVAHAGFGAAVRYQFEAKGRLIVVRRLLGVAYVKFDVVGTFDGEGILFDRCLLIG